MLGSKLCLDPLKISFSLPICHCRIIGFLFGFEEVGIVFYDRLTKSSFSKLTLLKLLNGFPQCIGYSIQVFGFVDVPFKDLRRFDFVLNAS